jgi:hypothetical protein
MSDVIVGIDLGTTNSEVAALVDGTVQVLAGPDGEQIMPSCVGLAPDGALLVGTPARNQFGVYPERTVKSIKRLMGSDRTVTLGDRAYTPPEISAIILRTRTSPTPNDRRRATPARSPGSRLSASSTSPRRRRSHTARTGPASAPCSSTTWAAGPSTCRSSRGRAT